MTVEGCFQQSICFFKERHRMEEKKVYGRGTKQWKAFTGYWNMVKCSLAGCF